MRWNRRRPTAAADPEPQPETVDFVAYATDCVISGRVALGTGRLTDLLAAREDYDIDAVSLEVLNEDRIVVLHSAKVLREDLCLVAAAGPRGDPARRVRTRPHPIVARVGPYDVFGYVHAMPTADVLSAVHRRPIVPLTSGRIRYLRGTVPVEHNHDTILLNRDKIDWIETATDEEVGLARPPELPLAKNPRARDLTGELYTR